MSNRLREKYLLYLIQIKRDQKAYAELYDLCVASIYRFIYFKVASKEEAEDLTSEVFLKAWSYLADHRDVLNFTALIYRIARNLVIDYYRTRKQHVSLDETREAGGDGGEVNSMEQTDQGEQIVQTEIALDAAKVIESMKLLKDEYREALMFRYIDELSVSEIAEILGKSSVGVRVLLHRATKTLEQVIQKQVVEKGVEKSSSKT